MADKSQLFEEVPCNFCGESEREVVFRSRDRLHQFVPSDVWCDIVRCVKCNLVYLNLRVREEHIGDFYPKNEYFAYTSTGVESTLRRLKGDLYRIIAKRHYEYPARNIRLQSGLSSSLLALLAWIAFAIFPSRYRRILPYMSGGNVLEFGFGAGDYLCRLQDLGWECWGVERNGAAVEQMNNRGVRSFLDLWHQEIPSNYFDWITSYHSLEHVFDPMNALRRFHQLLKPGGKVFIGVPNFDSVAGRVFRGYWHNLGVPIHPYVFTARSLRMYLQACDFTGLELRYRSLNDAILGSIQKVLDEAIGRLLGRKYVGKFLLNSRLCQVVLKPLEKLCDVMHLGDCIEVTAIKTSD